MSAIGVNFTFQLFLLLCLPLPSVAETLLSPSAPRVSDTLINTVPYTLASGETVFTLATKYHLTLEQLKKLNQFRSFSKPFTQLGAGDEIDIPRTESLFLKNRDLPAPSRPANMKRNWPVDCNKGEPYYPVTTPVVQ
ncbi:LysM domain-containing protein [Yersinia intermedia]|nr:LysM domain-containing protein [Yersinia intermedia]